MRQKAIGSEFGFTLMEALITLLVGTVLMTGALSLIRPATDIAQMVRLRGETQQNARVAANMISRDLSLAGTGLPLGGIQLPDGPNANDSNRACDNGGCYIDNPIFVARRLFAVTTGNGRGPNVNSINTDVATIVYRDDTTAFDQFPLVDIDDDEVEFDPNTDPAIDDTILGLEVDDIMALCNSNGCAAATVTLVNGGTEKVEFKSGDVLNFNQTGADVGNIAALANADGSFPPTTAFRLWAISYFIDNTVATQPTLMRQVNGHSPVPVAENILNLQFSYDIFDENTATATASLVDAGGFPNQIRKINLSVTARSPRERLFGRGFDGTTLVTSVSARNLSFRDRYE